MKWAILVKTRYSPKIKFVEAYSAAEAAQKFLSADTTGRGSGRRIVRVIDIEAETLREFQLAPPPAEQWIVTEVTEDEEDDDLDEDEDPEA